MAPLGILSRFVVALAIALLGVSLSQADRPETQSGPAAESLIDQTIGVVTGQRHVLRAHLPGDDIPDPAGQGAAVQVPDAPASVRIVSAEGAQLHIATTCILPPVRGPPAV